MIRAVRSSTMYNDTEREYGFFNSNYVSCNPLSLIICRPLIFYVSLDVNGSECSPNRSQQRLAYGHLRLREVWTARVIGPERCF